MMKLNELFPDIFVINLDRRVDRMRHIMNQSIKHSFVFERISAVDGNDITNPSHLRAGEYALLLSHLKALEIAKERGLEKVLILEDDAEFVDNLEDKLHQVLQVPDDWEVIMLSGNHYMLGAGTIISQTISDNVARVFSSFTTHAMVIRGTVFDTMIEAIKTKLKPLDLIYVEVLQSKGTVYAILPNLGGQYDSHSDILGFNPQYSNIGLYRQNNIHA